MYPSWCYLGFLEVKVCSVINQPLAMGHIVINIYDNINNMLPEVNRLIRFSSYLYLLAMSVF